MEEASGMIILVLYTLSFNVVIGEDSVNEVSLRKDNDPLTRHQKALKHVSSFLGIMQTQVQESRRVLNRIDLAGSQSDAKCVCPNVTNQPLRDGNNPQVSLSDFTVITEETPAHPHYLTTGFRILLEKLGVNKENLRSVLMETEKVIKSSIARLSWLEQPMLTILVNIGIITSQSSIDMYSVAYEMYFAMVHPKEMIKADVRELLDVADDLIQEIDGNHLLKTIEEFGDFPIVQKTPEVMCFDVIEAFDRPFTKIKDRVELRKLVLRANSLFVQYYPFLNKHQTIPPPPVITDLKIPIPGFYIR